MRGNMSKVVTVEYDAEEKVLRLAEPLEGVEDHAKLRATLETPPSNRWALLRSTVSEDQLDELETIIDEMFPIEK
jgi:hypothetical protein